MPLFKGLLRQAFFFYETPFMTEPLRIVFAGTRNSPPNISRPC